MTPMDEKAYQTGERLGVHVDGAVALKERMAVVVLLRRLCVQHGDNDWPDNMHIADVIEKHLMRHLLAHKP